VSFFAVAILHVLRRACDGRSGAEMPATISPSSEPTTKHLDSINSGLLTTDWEGGSLREHRAARRSSAADRHLVRRTILEFFSAGRTFLWRIRAALRKRSAIASKSTTRHLGPGSVSRFTVSVLKERSGPARDDLIFQDLTRSASWRRRWPQEADAALGRWPPGWRTSCATRWPPSAARFRF